ncbi:hypothetical protein DS901_05310 [Loktanella sp. D2R18]|uniref:transferrin-binding protein-like solute binding protein n=1 Tax=Rhodobacterales TaxID=204455 RepID=UPI000DE8E1AA|nr:MULTISPECIES: transferrin-binding protein-like solute binding protein [Rhodobacterales]MDO6590721.1 transferrin-binding protein-like solute binding protein [Yoonia sp. 1_MG-2023]RBW44659.1 hypothetical protein DS901_05310 [Loktanella sp. D2R18]
MKTTATKSMILIALLSTTACGGGGGDEDPVVTPDPGANGLPYGVVGQDLSDAEGTEMSLAAAGYDTSVGASVTQGGTVTLATDFLTGGPADLSALDATIFMFGEEVTISNGSGVLNGNVVTLTYEPSRSGDYAGAISIANHTSGGVYQGETAYVFGFETDPADMETIGTVNYSGGFLAQGVSGASEAEYEGTIAIAVNFAGTATGSLDGVVGGSTDMDMTLSGGTLSGNAITAGLGCSVGCSGDGDLDATFYGPNADELGGVLAIDTNTFEGAGTFIITVTGS